MGKNFTIQIGGKTYTAENLHELADDPNVTPADGTVTNIAYGGNTGIQAGNIYGDLHIGTGDR